MTTVQKIIKYLAIAFAIFLIVSIVSAILGGIYGLAFILGIKQNEPLTELNTIEWDNNELPTILEIDVRYSNLQIKTGNNFIAQTNNPNIECAQTNNTLVIKEKGNNWFNKNNKYELTVYIPTELEFQEVEIENGAGTINIEAIVAEKLILNLGAGETTIKNVNANNLKIDNGTGRLMISSGRIKDLDLDMGVGETEISANLVGNSKIDTGVGSLKLNLSDNEEAYRIKVNKGIGTISLNGKELLDNTINGNGENFIDINGGIGEIKIKTK